MQNSPGMKFSIQGSTGTITYLNTFDVVVEGVIEDTSNIKNKTIHYVAAAPADMRASYTGSGLPFTSPEMALQGSPNFGSVYLNDSKTFKISLKMPNSYYAGHGSVIIPPTLYLIYHDNANTEKNIAIVLRNSIPFRTLTYPNLRKSAMFYDVRQPVRSQESILRASAYPEHAAEPSNFWGLRPPY